MRRWPSCRPRRSIPACAGEAKPARRAACRRKVYPRVCGGSVRVVFAESGDQGLSPRVRGKRHRVAQLCRMTRSIPACAGEAPAGSSSTFGRWVYPRVCGGSLLAPVVSPEMVGLSPRVRGKRCSIRSHSPPPGLSPRVRGKPTDSPVNALERRSIPACAGEATGGTQWSWMSGVYPRVCGGSELFAGNLRIGEGLSPRVRGKLRCAAYGCHSPGSIPACAGEARRHCRQHPDNPVYPRVCGGSGAVGYSVRDARGLSPRVRGKHCVPCRNTYAARSIPACAGEARYRRRKIRLRQVYPRVCGGSYAQ